MNGNKRIDSLCYYILNTIDLNVLKSLSPDQLSAIEDATRACQLREKHPIDIRGTINLLFIKFYYALLIGRDRRLSEQQIEGERREKVTLLGNVIYAIYVLLGITGAVMVVIWLILMLLYILKIGLGIDFFPGEHMGKYLGF